MERGTLDSVESFSSSPSSSFSSEPTGSPPLAPFLSAGLVEGEAAAEAGEQSSVAGQEAEAGDKENKVFVREEESDRPPKRWRGVLGSEELLTERDQKVLSSLEEKEPAILDEVTRYWLHAVGCAATDRTVARLVSVAVQLAAERVIDDAKLLYFCRRATEEKSKEAPTSRERLARPRGAPGASANAFANGKTPMDYRELDLESFCAAFRKNGDSLVGHNLDLFLDASPSPLPGALASSLSSSLPTSSSSASSLSIPPA
ncbi:hypothetical protein BESB_055900 [Besnoitia besnoiti]|uniref:Transcription initiation factor TFIID 23-30 kDa subunit n=1 Tax=Besnoitia besnoiti TaxID=94643 RepID=A0A2A9MDI9_BESBE|nr:hypothetical protein BESB_055900 [Besnoitia besnoiti]PFH35939.1 hypothetical protein BESB_055900 [Besnoitia besnoiti]